MGAREAQGGAKNMSLSNANKKYILNHMNQKAGVVGLGDLIFGSGAGGQIGYKAVSAAYTATEEDSLIAQSANAAVTLPAASSVSAGKRLEVYFSHASGGDIVRASGDTIGGVAANPSQPQYSRVVLTSDGVSNWIL